MATDLCRIGITNLFACSLDLQVIEILGVILLLNSVDKMTKDLAHPLKTCTRFDDKSNRLPLGDFDISFEESRVAET